ncbi:hypothetical protein JKP88DRAFT_241633 [Tribonema minus]|uniref:Uncharacterized protein n=1 Tax=Tribonema minus TaxID=303371 RepID=A0A835Z358_9STRA|nr:hypothetical protein JKP88DRAFT_241633 [Tribonema minus]
MSTQGAAACNGMYTCMYALCASAATQVSQRGRPSVRRRRGGAPGGAENDYETDAQFQAGFEQVRRDGDGCLPQCRGVHVGGSSCTARHKVVGAPDWPGRSPRVRLKRCCHHMQHLRAAPTRLAYPIIRAPSEVAPEQRRIANATWVSLVAAFLIYSCFSVWAAITEHNCHTALTPAPCARHLRPAHDTCALRRRRAQNPTDERHFNFSAPSISICIEGNVGCATSIYNNTWTTDDCLESSLKYHAKVGYTGEFTEVHDKKTDYFPLLLVRNGSEVGQGLLPTASDQYGMSCWVVDSSKWEYQSVAAVLVQVPMQCLLISGSRQCCCVNENIAGAASAGHDDASVMRACMSCRGLTRGFSCSADACATGTRAATANQICAPGFSMDILAVWDTNYIEARYAVQAHVGGALFQSVADVWIWQGVYDADGNSIEGAGSNCPPSHVFHSHTRTTHGAAPRCRATMTQARKLASMPLTIYSGPYGTGNHSAIHYDGSTYQLTRSRLNYANGSYAMFYNGVVSTAPRYSTIYLKGYDEDADGNPLGPDARSKPLTLDNVAIAKIYMSLDPGIYTMFSELTQTHVIRCICAGCTAPQVNPNWFTIASTVYGLWPIVAVVFGLLFTTRVATMRYLVCKGPREELLTPRVLVQTRAAASEHRASGPAGDDLERNWFRDAKVRLSSMSLRLMPRGLARESAPPQPLARQQPSSKPWFPLEQVSSVQEDPDAPSGSQGLENGVDDSGSTAGVSFLGLVGGADDSGTTAASLPESSAPSLPPRPAAAAELSIRSTHLQGFGRGLGPAA